MPQSHTLKVNDEQKCAPNVTLKLRIGNGRNEKIQVDQTYHHLKFKNQP